MRPYANYLDRLVAIRLFVSARWMILRYNVWYALTVPVFTPAEPSSFTDRWRWSRAARDYRKLIRLAYAMHVGEETKCPPMLWPDTYPMFVAFEARGFRL